MTNIIEIMKHKALQDMKTTKSWFGMHQEFINGQEVTAYVSKQKRSSNRVYDAMFCNWYLNGKKSSLAKVLEAIK